MKRNLLWLIGILALVAAAALLRPQPAQTPSPTPRPLQTPTASPNPALLSYFEETLKKERFSFEVLGRPGAHSFHCLMTVEWKNIEDSGSLSEGEFSKIQSALQRASSAERSSPPIDVLAPKRPAKRVEFSLPERNYSRLFEPEPNSLTRRVLDQELQHTLVFRERDQLRKEMHARFNL